MLRNKHRITRLFSVLFFSSLFGVSALPQGIKVIGIVKDEITSAPIGGVNIKITGTNKGTFTDKDGRFFLNIDQVPSSITLTCLGYEAVYFDIKKRFQKNLDLIMRPRVYGLQEVDVSAQQFKYVFNDQEHSVLDYEIMDDKLLLLIFRHQLRRSELILLTLAGDTVKITSVPEMKPKCLYKDFLDHVHYISTAGNAFQCYYNDTLNQFRFFYQTTYDSLRMMVQPFLFTASDRTYFQEFTPDGAGKKIGYFDQTRNKHYIQSFSGEETRKKFNDDLRFYSQWNTSLERTTSNNPARISGDDFRANNLFNYRKLNTPLVKIGEDKIAVFNFPEDAIELMDLTGNVYKSVPISFHKEADVNIIVGILSAIIPIVDWQWSGKIYIDEYFRDAYTTFKKNGMVQIRKIDLETGKLTESHDIPFPFPEKLEIYKGTAYFLNKVIGGDFENWKLVKVKL